MTQKPNPTYGVVTEGALSIGYDGATGRVKIWQHQPKRVKLLCSIEADQVPTLSLLLRRLMRLWANSTWDQFDVTRAEIIQAEKKSMS